MNENNNPSLTKGGEKADMKEKKRKWMVRRRREERSEEGRKKEEKEEEEAEEWGEKPLQWAMAAWRRDGTLCLCNEKLINSWREEKRKYFNGKREAEDDNISSLCVKKERKASGRYTNVIPMAWRQTISIETSSGMAA